MRLEWLQRMKNALDLIEGNMEEQLDITEIARAACSSTFHFQRMFNILTGMTVAEYVRKRKLTLAAQELALTDAKVLDVALKYGYDSPESFAKAFRKAHGIPPSAARDPGVSLKAFPRITFHLSLKGDKEMDYKIVEKDAFTVIGKSLKASMRDGENNRQIPQFWSQCNNDGTVEKLLSVGSGKNALGICMDTDHVKEQFTYIIGAEVDSANRHANHGFNTWNFPACTWAVFPSVGSMPGAIRKVWERVFQEWFPSTGYEHAAGLDMEVYPPGDVNAEDYYCEVWVPIVKK
jgi:AraC family transcriptional regulator